MERFPYRGDINGSVGVNIKVSGVFNNAPWNGCVLLLHFIRKLRNQFTDLDNAHAASIQKHVVLFKGGVFVMIAFQMVFDTLAIADDLTQYGFIPRFDKAAPRLSQWRSKILDRRNRL